MSRPGAVAAATPPIAQYASARVTAAAGAAAAASAAATAAAEAAPLLATSLAGAVGEGVSAQAWATQVGHSHAGSHLGFSCHSHAPHTCPQRATSVGASLASWIWTRRTGNPSRECVARGAARSIACVCVVRCVRARARVCVGDCLFLFECLRLCAAVCECACAFATHACARGWLRHGNSRELNEVVSVDESLAAAVPASRYMLARRRLLGPLRLARARVGLSD